MGVRDVRGCAGDAVQFLSPVFVSSSSPSLTPLSSPFPFSPPLPSPPPQERFQHVDHVRLVRDYNGFPKLDREGFCSACVIFGAKGDAEAQVMCYRAYGGGRGGGEGRRAGGRMDVRGGKVGRIL